MHLRDDIVAHDQNSTEALQLLDSIVRLYTDIAWDWFCRFNTVYPNNQTGEYIPKALLLNV